MTPQEKAHFMVLQHIGELEDKTSNKAIKHALITIRELISYSEEWDDSEYFEEVEQCLLKKL